MDVGLETLEASVTCGNGHEIPYLRIVRVGDRQQLVDVAGNAIYELRLVCRLCGAVVYWTKSYRLMEQDAAAWNRLRESLATMHQHQEQLDQSALGLDQKDKEE